MGHIQIPALFDKKDPSRLISLANVASGRGAVKVANSIKDFSATYSKSILYETDISG